MHALFRFIKNIFTGLFTLCTLGVSAQTDSATVLPELTVAEPRFDQTGYRIHRADTIPLLQPGTLAERLLWENNLDVRSNAPGTLATLSMRGTGPAHTPVYWEGLNLQSPMNGVVDAALLPLWADDRLELRYGGQSAALSSGAMGGSVLISSGVFESEQDGWFGSLGASAGSFSTRTGHASLGFQGKTFATCLRAAGQQAHNDFPFRNTAQIGAPLQRQQNNYGEKLDIQQFNHLKLNPENTIETSAWYQRAYREIPPSMTEAPARTWQRDRALRAVANWRHTGSARAQWQTRVAWLDEGLDFFLEGDTDTSRSRTAIASTEYTLAVAPHLIVKAGTTAWWQSARVDGYIDSTRWYDQTRLAAVVMGEYYRSRWRFTALFRQEWAENQAAPFTWALGAEYRPKPAWILRTHLSRNFYLPTFNDRYWKALGNTDLRPEKGYSADAGLSWRYKAFVTDASVFTLLIDDWILWQPGPDGQFRPGNLRQVWSRGLEYAVGAEKKWRNNRWKLRVHYQLTRATNTGVYQSSANVLHKQLPYTAVHAGGVSLSWSNRFFSLLYLHRGTGQRYSNSDNSTRLPAFQVGDVLASVDLNAWVEGLHLEARLENCWNEPYQVIAFRPMPGRAWRVGADWRF